MTAEAEILVHGHLARKQSTDQNLFLHISHSVILPVAENEDATTVSWFILSQRFNLKRRKESDFVPTASWLCVVHLGFYIQSILDQA